jgi:hypothetical protein
MGGYHLLVYADEASLSWKSKYDKGESRMLPDVSNKIQVDTDCEYMLIYNQQDTGEQFHLKAE